MMFFTQPALRWAQVMMLTDILKKNENFMAGDAEKRKLFFQKLRSKVPGDLTEDAILYETIQALPKHLQVFKFMFVNGGEFDMVVWNPDNMTYDLFEIKHRKTESEKPFTHLRDKGKLAITSKKFGNLQNRFLLWNGKNDVTPDGIIMKNNAAFLKELYIGQSRPLSPNVLADASYPEENAFWDEEDEEGFRGPA